MHGRTLEEAFVYENFSLFSAGDLDIDVELSGKLREDFDTIYKHIKSSSFKKTEFALHILSSSVNWRVPKYISDGLQWLDNKLTTNLNA